MKLTKREKILLLILGVCLVLFLYFNYLIKPQFAKIDKMKSTLEDYNLKAQTVKSQTSSDNKIFKDYKKLNGEIAAMTKRLFPSIIQEKIITMLEDTINTSKVEVGSLSFTEPQLNNVGEDQKEQEQQSSSLYDLAEQFMKTGKLTAAPDTAGTEADKAKEQNDKYKVVKMTATLACTGSYLDITNFIQGIELWSRKVIVKNVSIAQNDTDKLRATISLDFYAIPKLHDQDADYLDWTITGQYGKENPFDPFEGYVANKQPLDSYKLISIKNDFFITVNPLSADVPTVMIGKQGSNSAGSYATADNAGVENVEIQLTEKDGKYYFRYKTQGESYPSDYKQLAEFNPYGDSINIGIISAPRNSAGDRSGISLTVLNTTKLRANVFVSFDDKSSPRVNIAKTTGDVYVKRSEE